MGEIIFFLLLLTIASIPIVVATGVLFIVVATVQHYMDKLNRKKGD